MMAQSLIREWNLGACRGWQCQIPPLSPGGNKRLSKENTSYPAIPKATGKQRSKRQARYSNRKYLIFQSPLLHFYKLKRKKFVIYYKISVQRQRYNRKKARSVSEGNSGEVQQESEQRLLCWELLQGENLGLNPEPGWGEGGGSCPHSLVWNCTSLNPPKRTNPTQRRQSFCLPCAEHRGKKKGKIKQK